jgi:acetyl esterase
MGLTASAPVEGDPAVPVASANLCPDVRAHLAHAGPVGNIAHHVPISVMRLGYTLGHTLKEGKIAEYESKVTIKNTQILTKYGPENTSSCIPLRIYTPILPTVKHPGADASTAPASAAETPGIILLFHGGGYTIGSLDTHDTCCKLICAESQWPVVSVEYALAPVHHALAYPNCTDDCVAAYLWTVKHAADILSPLHPAFPAGIDSASPKIVLTGDSAGGNLTISVSIRIRDHNRAVAARAARRVEASTASGPVATPRAGLIWNEQSHVVEPVLQAPIYPAIDHTGSLPSRKQYPWGYELTAGLLNVFTTAYFGTDPDTVEALTHDTLLSPYFNNDLTDLPPALTLTAQYDLLHDDGVEYHKKLQAAGVPSEHMEGEGLIHGFATHIVSMTSGRAKMIQFVARIKELVALHAGRIVATAS